MWKPLLIWRCHLTLSGNIIHIYLSWWKSFLLLYIAPDRIYGYFPFSAQKKKTTKNNNTCWGYSSEAPRWGTSNEYPKHTFCAEIRKIFTWHPLLSGAILHLLTEKLEFTILLLLFLHTGKIFILCTTAVCLCISECLIILKTAFTETTVFFLQLHFFELHILNLHLFKTAVFILLWEVDVIWLL